MPPRILVLLLLASLPSLVGAGTVELLPVRDNTLFEDAEGDTSNGSGTGIFCGRNSQGRVRRAVLAFDLSSALPDGARLDSAVLVMHMASSSDPLERLLTLHRVLADWGEGASASGGGGGAPAQPGDATWLHTFHPSTFWSAPGGDFSPSPSASLRVPGEVEGEHVFRSDALTEDVRAWIAGTAGSFGWTLLGDESVPNSARRFDSRESTTPAFRPRLVLHHSSVTPALRGTWGRLKSRFR